MEEVRKPSEGTLRRADEAERAVLHRFTPADRQGGDVQAAAYYASEGAMIGEEERQREIERNPLGYIEEVLDFAEKEYTEGKEFISRGRERLGESIAFWKGEVNSRNRQADDYRMKRPTLTDIAKGAQAAYQNEPITGRIVQGSNYVPLPRARIISPYEDEGTHQLHSPSGAFIEEVFKDFGALGKDQTLAREVERRTRRTSMVPLNEGNLVFTTDVPGVYLQYDQTHGAVNLLYPLSILKQ